MERNPLGSVTPSTTPLTCGIYLFFFLFKYHSNNLGLIATYNMSPGLVLIFKNGRKPNILKEFIYGKI